jgi:hypothetical protein
MIAVRAEDHGLSPLVRRHVKDCGIQLPEAVSQQLTAMAIRHRDASRVQTATLFELVDAFDTAGITHVVLKGAILALDIYPHPELRPRRDIDILVAPGDGQRARTVLQDLGFQGAVHSLRRASHHHLPEVVRDREGYHVSVEVHEDAVSRDQPGSLTFRTMVQRPREVVVDGHRLCAFGHADMLRHLSAHVLEPGFNTRLLGVTDLVEYAARYAAEIDWKSIRRLDPRTINTLSVMEYVTPLPEALAPVRPDAGARPPTGAGRGFPPLSTVTLGRGRAGQALTALLYPSDWWMHAYYGVPPGRPLFLARWGRHVWRLAYWGLRRAGVWRPSFRARAGPDS